MAGAWSRRLVRALGLLPAIMVLVATAHGQTIDITKLRDLNFGTCDNTAGATYTVSATATQPSSACFGAQSAEFTVTAPPTQRLRITSPNTVTVTNGAESLDVAITRSVANSPMCLPGGSITVYVGGSTTLPAGGLGTTGVFFVSTQLQANTVGGNC